MAGQKLYQLEATSVPLPTTFFLISYQKPPNACEGVGRERREPPHEDGARWRRYWASPPPPWPTRRVRPGPPAACEQRQAAPAPPDPPAVRISQQLLRPDARVRLWCPRSSRRPGRGTRRAAAAAALPPHAPVATPTIAARRPLRAGAARLGLHARPRVDAVVLDDALHPACGRHDGGPRRERAQRWARAQGTRGGKRRAADCAAPVAGCAHKSPPPAMVAADDAPAGRRGAVGGIWLRRQASDCPARLSISNAAPKKNARQHTQRVTNTLPYNCVMTSLPCVAGAAFVAVLL